VKLPIRLLAIDIDGTLLNSKFTISAADLAALRRVNELGIELLLCTGRRHTFAMSISRQLGFDHWLCSSNGAVTRSNRGESFHSDVLPVRTARALVAHMKEFRGSTVLTFDKETKGALVVERTDELAGSVGRWLETNAPFIDHVTPIEDCLTCDPLQAMFCGTIERMKKVENVLSRFQQLDELTVLKTQYDYRDLCLLDVLRRDCSKGHALERWAKSRGIANHEIMAIGDNYNDVEMLEIAGYPVIMGNACAELKQNGWTETLTNDESGVSAALEQVLGREMVAQ
jgi:Cof subfamily protein (haloacid dehalogenase superfamily)